MLQALYDALLKNLQALQVSDELLSNYKRHWNDTLLGQFKGFPCPACFLSGGHHAALKSLPSKASTFYVQCSACGKVFSYMEEDF